MLIEEVIKDILQKVPAQVDAEDLMGFLIDVDNALSSEELFHDIQVKATGIPGCGIQASAVTSSATSLQDISKALAQVWKGIYYMSFHAASCSWYRNYTELRFITMSDSATYCVTGKIIVTAPHQNELVKQFEEKFNIPGRASRIKD